MSTDAAAVASLEQALRDALDAGVSAGDASYAVDGIVPPWIATPSSVDQLVAVLAVANEHGAAVIPWGGGWHMSLGNIPARCDLALRTSALDRVIEHEPADLTITVAAGITIGRLQSLLAEHGQFLPIDTPPEATIGGVLASGVSGPSRHAYGIPRDWLIGCRVAHADGSVSKGGGRVVKNVAGYDMPKLAVGSLGTLGVIVEATLKVAPLPAAQETLVVRCESVAAVADLIGAADDRGLALRAVAIVDGAKAAFWLAGPGAAVERTARELRDLSRGSETERFEGDRSSAWWAQLVDAYAPDGGIAIKVSLPPSAVAGYIERLTALAVEASLPLKTHAYVTTGLVLAYAGPAAVDALVRVIEQARALSVTSGGALVVTSAPVEVKQRIDVWGDPSTGSEQAPSSALPLMRRLKEQFDPRGTLNPGRYVGGL